MTKITITKDYIELDGHAEPIVCAAISTMSDFLECHDELNKETKRDGYIKLTGIKDSSVLKVFIYLIKQLATQYPDNVNVKEIKNENI